MLSVRFWLSAKLPGPHIVAGFLFFPSCPTIPVLNVLTFFPLIRTIHATVFISDFFCRTIRRDAYSSDATL
jgi:hypothetical protein